MQSARQNKEADTPLGMTVLQSGVAREEMTRKDAVLRKRKRPTAFVEIAYADTRKTTTKRGLGKWEAAFREDGWGQETVSLLLHFYHWSHPPIATAPQGHLVSF